MAVSLMLMKSSFHLSLRAPRAGRWTRPTFRKVKKGWVLTFNTHQITRVTDAEQVPVANEISNCAW